MTGTTHANLGIACALTTCLVTKQTEPLELITAASMGAFGGLLSDVDADGGSKFKNFFTKVLVAVIFVSIISISYVKQNNIDVNQFINIIKQSDKLIALIVFFILCLIGYMCPHRTFPHYLIAVPIYTAPIYIIGGLYPAIFFAIGMLSHQVIDLLNKKTTKWLFPLPMDCAKYKCESKSGSDQAIGVVSMLLSALILFVIYKDQIEAFFLY